MYFPLNRPVIWDFNVSFNVSFIINMKKLLNEQPKGWWFETMALMWHHCVCFAHACRVPATLENMHWPVQSNYSDVIMGGMAFQITSATSVYSSVYSGEDQRKHQSSASLAFVRGIHRSPVNSPHKWLVTRKMFPFDDVIMRYLDHQKRHSDGHPLSHMSIAKPLTHSHQTGNVPLTFPECYDQVSR